MLMINWKEQPVEAIFGALTLVVTFILIVILVYIIIQDKNSNHIRIYINDGQQKIEKRGCYVTSDINNIEVYIQYPDGTLHKYVPENKGDAA